MVRYSMRWLSMDELGWWGMLWYGMVGIERYGVVWYETFVVCQLFLYL